MNKLKLLAKIQNDTINVRYNDFVALLHAYGFKCTRKNGSHEIFRNMCIHEIINIQNVNGKAKSYQIKQFLSLVEKYNLRLEVENNDA